MIRHDIFVSYSRFDSERVKPVIARIRQSGFTVWIDEDGIESGDAFKKIIVSAIEDCKVVLFFSSKYSNTSSWTEKEIGIAREEQKPIIPIKLDNSKYNPSVRLDLVNLDYIEFFNNKDLDIKLPRIITTLRNKCGRLDIPFTNITANINKTIHHTATNTIQQTRSQQFPKRTADNTSKDNGEPKKKIKTVSTLTKTLLIIGAVVGLPAFVFFVALIFVVVDKSNTTDPVWVEVDSVEVETAIVEEDNYDNSDDNNLIYIEGDGNDVQYAD